MEGDWEVQSFPHLWSVDGHVFGHYYKLGRLTDFAERGNPEEGESCSYLAAASSTGYGSEAHPGSWHCVLFYFLVGGGKFWLTLSS
jgi:hypothetical protein